MSIEFLIDNSRKELEKLNKLIKDVGVVKKQDEKSKFLKKFMVEAIRAKHHIMHAERHKLSNIRIQPLMLQPARRQVPYFKPHEIYKLKRLPEKKRYFTITENEYPLLKAGNYTLVRAVVDRDYKVIEPPLTDLDVRMINDLKSKGIISDDAINARLGSLGASLVSAISQDYVEKIKYYIKRDNMLGKIAFIMRDDRVKTVTCPGLSQAVHVTFNGKDLETDIMYIKLEEINNVVLGLAKLSGEILNNFNPILDATLQNGTRVQAILGNEIVTPKFVITK